MVSTKTVVISQIFIILNRFYLVKHMRTSDDKRYKNNNQKNHAAFKVVLVVVF